MYDSHVAYIWLIYDSCVAYISLIYDSYVAYIWLAMTPVRATWVEVTLLDIICFVKDSFAERKRKIVVSGRLYEILDQI